MQQIDKTPAQGASGNGKTYPTSGGSRQFRLLSDDELRTVTDYELPRAERAYDPGEMVKAYGRMHSHADADVRAAKMLITIVALGVTLVLGVIGAFTIMEIITVINAEALLGQ